MHPRVASELAWQRTAAFTFSKLAAFDGGCCAGSIRNKVRQQKGIDKRVFDNDDDHPAPAIH